LADKQKGLGCASQAPSTNDTGTTNKSKLLPAPVPPDKSFHSPAEPRLAPDNRGEDDWAYFRARPAATTRTRFPLENEFPDDFRVAFVRVAVVRDDRGQPVWAARSVRFCEGGSA
jgi:hypothetical protein